MDDVCVLIVSDDPLARAGLAALLADQPGCTVVGQVAGGAELPDEITIYQPDAILWDLGWEPTSPLERLTDLDQVVIPIVALLTDETQAAEVWAAGSRGLLPRETDVESLVAALRAVAQGLVVVDPVLAADVLPTPDPPPEPLVEALTRRELQVLQLLAEGFSNKAIAHRLDISQHTVKFHVNAILGKLGARSRTEAVVRATRLGLIIL